MNKFNILILFFIIYFILITMDIFQPKKYNLIEIIKRVLIFSICFLFFLIFKLIDFNDVILLSIVFIILNLIEFIVRKIYYNKLPSKSICYISLCKSNIEDTDIIDFCNNYHIKIESIKKYNKLIDVKSLKKYDILIINSDAHQKFLLDLSILASDVEVYLKLTDEIIPISNNRIIVLKDIPFVKINKLQIDGLNKLLKRVFDIFFSIIAMVILFPIILFVSILVKIDSYGPIFYSQERETIYNKKFKLYKFRSMYVNAEKDGIPLVASPNDTRITKIGRFIRKFKIDEIPQLYNVLKGEMSIVGPRPERTYFIDKYKKEYPLYNLRHNVKAGITGLSHIYGNYYTEPKYRYLYDLYYISNYSLLLDIKIIFKTFFVILHLK